MNAKSPFTKFPFQLSYALEERLALYVADCSTNFSYHEIIVVLLTKQHHVALYLVSDVRNYLYSLSQIIATALLIYNGLVYTTGSKIICLGCLNTGEAFVMSQIQVCFVSVHSHVAFAVLIRVQRTWVDVNIRVKLLDCNVVASGLKKFAD